MKDKQDCLGGAVDGSEICDFLSSVFSAHEWEGSEAMGR